MMGNRNKLRLKVNHAKAGNCKAFGHKMDNGVCIYCSYNPKPLKDAEQKVLRLAESWAKGYGSPQTLKDEEKLFEASIDLLALKEKEA